MNFGRSSRKGRGRPRAGCRRVGNRCRVVIKFEPDLVQAFVVVVAILLRHS